MNNYTILDNGRAVIPPDEPETDRMARPPFPSVPMLLSRASNRESFTGYTSTAVMLNRNPLGAIKRASTFLLEAAVVVGIIFCLMAYCMGSEFTRGMSDEAYAQCSSMEEPHTTTGVFVGEVVSHIAQGCGPILGERLASIIQSDCEIVRHVTEETRTSLVQSPLASFFEDVCQ